MTSPRPSTPRTSSRDGRMFKVVTGAVASIVLLLVAGILFVLVHESTLSIEKFGLGFWVTRTWSRVKSIVDE